MTTLDFVSKDAHEAIGENTVLTYIPVALTYGTGELSGDVSIIDGTPETRKVNAQPLSEEAVVAMNGVSGQKGLTIYDRNFPMLPLSSKIIVDNVYYTIMSIDPWKDGKYSIYKAIEKRSKGNVS